MEMALQGSFHQGHSQFKGAGRQCTCNSLSAMLHAHQRNPSEWSTFDIDSVLVFGDQIYSSIWETTKTSSPNHLLISDLPVEVSFNDTLYQMFVHQSSSGTLNRCTSEPPFMSLEDSLKETEMFSFITIGCYTMAVLQSETCFYLYDSHSRNELGMSSPEGKAVLTRHTSLTNLCHFVRHLAATVLTKDEFQLFEITEIKLSTPDDSCETFDGFSDISEGEYSCLLQAMDEDLKAKIDQINNESGSDCDAEIQSDSSCSSVQTNDTEVDNWDDPTISIVPDNEIYVATKVVVGGNSSSAPSFEKSEDITSEPDLNGSFVDKVILQGYLNEHDFSFNLLDESDDEDNVPLSLIKDKITLSSKTHQESSPLETIDTNVLNIQTMVVSPCETETISPSNFSELVDSENFHADVTTPNGDAENTSTPRGRKRTRNEGVWKRNMAKKLRNTGKEYTSTQNKVKNARIMKKGCNQGCRYKCNEKINDVQRQSIFYEFWSLGDINRQRDYIASWFILKPKKSNTNLNMTSSRHTSRRWQFKVEGVLVTVCKTFFLDTLDISHSVVDTAMRKGLHKENNVAGIGSPDKRGKHTNRRNKVPSEQIDEVTSHINSFPKVESHYCRKDTSRLYLEPGLSVPKMYQLYLSHCEEKTLMPVTIYTYRYIFDTKFNIAFHKPTKDRCEFCSRYQNSTESERDTLEADYTNHILNKKKGREMKEEDKTSSKTNPNFTGACFDLQQILLTPHSNESVLYYSRKLCIFNLTVYDFASKEGFCYMWHEAMSGRGACEIATCVYRYLQVQAGLGKKEVVLYSDNCGGQNRNKFFLTMLCYAKKHLGFTKLQHKFLERGHTQNENDSVHAAIECNSRNRSIYTTPQWAATVRSSRSKPYKVEELDSQDFIDFKQLSSVIPNFDFDINGQKLKWLKIKVVSFEENSCGIVKIQYNDSSSVTVNLGVRRATTRAGKSQNTNALTFPTLKLLYCVNQPPKLSAAKYKALIQLCKKNVIPRVHHQFYYSLRHESDDESDIV